MGCFDTVEVPCPKCGEPEYCQSKGGPCLLDNFTLKDAPLDVLSDVNRHAPYTCRKCGHVWSVDEPMLIAARGLYPAEPNCLSCANLRSRVALLEGALGRLLGVYDSLVHSEFDTPRNHEPELLREADFAREALEKGK